MPKRELLTLCERFPTARFELKPDELFRKVKRVDGDAVGNRQPLGLLSYGKPS